MRGEADAAQCEEEWIRYFSQKCAISPKFSAGCPELMEFADDLRYDGLAAEGRQDVKAGDIATLIKQVLDRHGLCEKVAPIG